VDEVIDKAGLAGLKQRPHGLLMAWVNVVLMVALQLPLAGRLFPGESLGTQVEREGVYWTLTAILLGYITLVERRPLSSVNLRWPTWKSLGFGVAGGLVMVMGIAFLYIKVLPALGPTTSESQLDTIRTMPIWFRLALVLRAGVFEELFYRGFVIERLTELIGLRWLAAVISLAAFTYAHLGYWGWAHLLIAGFGGFILSGLYLWRRDLPTSMIAHLVTDGVGFLAG
jgi:membrane protease YdiL (CAAX protease family)